MTETALVIFTVLSQLSIGAFAALFVADALQGKLENKQARGAAWGIFAAGAVALGASLFHLGQPLGAYRALLNLGSSWLSREVLTCVLFVGAVLLYVLLGSKEVLGVQGSAVKKGLGGAALIFGLLTIVFSANVYMLPAMPAWNTPYTLLSFLLTAAMGFFIMGYLTKEQSERMSLYAALVAVLALAASVCYIFILGSGVEASQAAQETVMGSPFMWIKMGLYGIMLGIALAMVLKKSLAKPSTVVLLFSCAALAEFSGRVLFYLSGVHL